MATYTVQKGDTLSEIAEKYYSTYGYSSTDAYMTYLVKRNDISNPDYIVVGQVLQMDGATTTATNKTSRATIKTFGVKSDGDELFVSWKWDKSYTAEYKIKWCYKDPNISDWIVAEESTVTVKQAIFSIPDKATCVRFNVKPIAKTRTVNGKEVSRWTAGWSVNKYYYTVDPPDVPSIDTFTIDQYKLTAKVTSVDADAKRVRFEVVKDDYTVYASTSILVTTQAATYTCTVAAGSEYKVRVRAERDSLYSEWSDYTSGLPAAPAKPSKISKIKGASETSVYLAWPEVKNATSYDIEYTTDKSYFGASNQTTTVNDVTTTHYTITGLQTGDEYFFRIRAVRGEQVSDWSSVYSVAIGKAPVAPTTWSSTTTAVVGEPVNLYWVHNAEDGSTETLAEIELTVDGELQQPSITIRNNPDADDADDTKCFTIDTSRYSEGVQIQWRVRTKGVTAAYGDWSVQRTIDIYAQPTLALGLQDYELQAFAELTKFPFYIYALPGPSSSNQAPIGYHVTITADESYETTDKVGNETYVKAGSEVYSKHFDVSSDTLYLMLSAEHIDLENNISYTVSCVVSMDSGLTAETTGSFTVAWMDIEYEPNAEIDIDPDNVSASIRPYCEDENGDLIEGVTLSVYRREYDGSFTEIMTNIANDGVTFVTDPHPALDYARYRIVASDASTGSVSFCDLAPYPVGEKAAIIQWAEDWSTFEGVHEDIYEQPNWTGSLLRLPYNIDVSNSTKKDVGLVEYVGRAHPVSYYGTQVGETMSWNVVIEKNDEETLYALRRLDKWMGDVYVREPSGSGYWAHVEVSFSQKHTELTIPVSLNITRVEGGV